MSFNSPSEAVLANMVTTSNKSAKGLKAVWTDKDDNILVSVLRTQKDAGNQASNGLKPSVWTVAVAKLLAEGSKKGGEKTSNKCNVLISNWFSKDDSTKTVTAHNDIWKKLKENKTTAKYYCWCKTPFSLYNDILSLVDGIVATGTMAFHTDDGNDEATQVMTPSLHRSSGWGPTMPQRLKAAIHQMEDDGDISDEDII
ncbi:hypothetical protein BDN67DRAFT_984333 [Paxillus ammoniavirescens]|nr:hypothetical protein BDN67DRAFT_984333 [Paxillus ammoniavirescens]